MLTSIHAFFECTSWILLWFVLYGTPQNTPPQNRRGGFPARDVCVPVLVKRRYIHVVHAVLVAVKQLGAKATTGARDGQIVDHPSGHAKRARTMPGTMVTPLVGRS